MLDRVPISLTNFLEMMTMRTDSVVAALQEVYFEWKSSAQSSLGNLSSASPRQQDGEVGIHGQHAEGSPATFRLTSHFSSNRYYCFDLTGRIHLQIGEFAWDHERFVVTDHSKARKSSRSRHFVCRLESCLRWPRPRGVHQEPSEVSVSLASRSAACSIARTHVEGATGPFQPLASPQPLEREG